MTSLANYWPPDGLSLDTPRLRLTVLTEADFPELLEAVLGGIHDPQSMPFLFPWTDAPADQLVPGALRYWWSIRGRVAPDDWTLAFVIRFEGRVLGLQELTARSFPVIRTVSSGSWLTRSVQGSGIGTEMRLAVLLLAFDHLGAERATSGAFTDNPASIAVSSRIGYADDGIEVRERRQGERAEQRRFLLTARTLNRPDWTLRVSGLDRCLGMLGVTDVPDASVQ